MEFATGYTTKLMQNQNQIYSKTILIEANSSTVWEALTNHQMMAEWMSDTKILILTDWKVGNPIVIKVQPEAYKAAFINTGIVLKFEPERILQYSHLSSLSKLLDQTENYTVITFMLSLKAEYTELTVELFNFPTESIFKHMEFYWNVTLEILRKFIERNRTEKIILDKL